MKKEKYHLIFDTETTGLPKNYNAPMSDTDNWPRLVQLSYILTNGKDRYEFDFIIKPEGFVIPKEVSKIHGISQKKALKEGVSIKFALRIFFAIISSTDVLVAHNLSFDIGIIGAEFYRLNSGRYIEKQLERVEHYCTMQNALIKGTHASGTKWPKLIELYKYFFNEEFDGAHNALIDTRACERCYMKMIKIK